MLEVGLLAEEVEKAGILFARIGTAVMLLPGTGEGAIPVRIRLAAALWLTLVGLSALGDGIVLPEGDAARIALLLGELMIGLLLGASARFVFMALYMAGELVAMLMALSAAVLFDPRQSAPNTIPSRFLAASGLVLLHVTGGHLFLLRGLFGSYRLLPLGELPAASAAEWLSVLSTEIWPLALAIAAPVVIVMMVTQLAFGLLGRLVPGIQVFFVALPLQILLALAGLLVGVTAALGWFLGRFDALLRPIGFG